MHANGRQKAGFSHCLALFVGDIPECKDLYSIKGEKRTKYPCHLCRAEKSETQKFTNCQRRDSRKTKHLLDSTESNDGDAKVGNENLNEMSLLLISPVLWKFQFAGVSACVVSAVFRIKKMHLFFPVLDAC